MKDREMEPEQTAEGPEDTPQAPQDETVETRIIEEPSQQEPIVEELAALRQELEAVKAKAAEYLDGWQRARAELSNARKRFQREQEQAYAYARADVLRDVLPVIDDFERATDTLPEDLSDSDWVNGVLLIRRKLETLLDQSGVVAIQAAGEEFDPLMHQAITHEPSSTVPEGHVIAEMQKGYRIGDRVLRPSMVRVSSGSPEAEAGDEATVKAEKEPAN